MKIFISIFLILILGFLTSKIKINVISLKNVRIEFYIFGIIKIYGFKLTDKKKLKKEKFQFLKSVFILDFFKILNIKLEKLRVKLEIGTDDVMLTVFLVTFISTFFSIISSINNKKYYYNITPVYNKVKLNYEVSAKISINTVNIIKAYKFMNKNKILEDNNINKKRIQNFLHNLNINKKVKESNRI